jgi:hypothetical protein
MRSLLQKKGRTFTMREFRKVKKFYTSVPWNKKHDFKMV